MAMCTFYCPCPKCVAFYADTQPIEHQRRICLSGASEKGA